MKIIIEMVDALDRYFDMTQAHRNVEYIRRRNLEDNQLFLEKLRLKYVRDSRRWHSRKLPLRFRFVKISSLLLVQFFATTKRKNTFIIRMKSTSFHCETLSLHSSRSCRVERNTRYNKKLKAGEIPPYVPERERRLEEKKQEAERKALEQQRKRLAYELKREEILFEKELRKIEREIFREERYGHRKPSKWKIFERAYSNPYQRVFLPRHTKVGERAEENF